MLNIGLDPTYTLPCAITKTSDLEIVKYLIKSGSILSETAIKRIVTYNRLDILEFICEPDTNRPIPSHSLILKCIFESSNLDMLKYMIKRYNYSMSKINKIIAPFYVNDIEFIKYICLLGFPIYKITNKNMQTYVSLFVKTKRNMDKCIKELNNNNNYIIV